MPKFWRVLLPGSSQILDPIKLFIVFPFHTLYFGQIPDPENTLPDPVQILLSANEQHPP